VVLQTRDDGLQPVIVSGQILWASGLPANELPANESIVEVAGALAYTDGLGRFEASVESLLPSQKLGVYDGESGASDEWQIADVGVKSGPKHWTVIAQMTAPNPLVGVSLLLYARSQWSHHSCISAET
jgi:hypothetical protein